MEIHYLIQGIFILVGILSILAALFDWNWFFTAHNAHFLVSRFGRKRARICYAILGGLMIFIGIYCFLTVRALPA